MPILHSPDVITPGQLGPISRDFEPQRSRLTFTMSSDRNAFGDGDDERDLGLDRLADRVGRARRRHIDHAGVGAGFRLGLGDGVEHRQPEMRRAAFARRGAADHLGAVGDRLLGMEGAVLAGEALADDLGVLVDEDGHVSRLCALPRSTKIRLGNRAPTVRKVHFKEQQHRLGFRTVTRHGNSFLAAFGSLAVLRQQPIAIQFGVGLVRDDAITDAPKVRWISDATSSATLPEITNPQIL